jgi:hypothetical protein
MNYMDAYKELWGRPAPYTYDQLPVADEYTSTEVRYFFAHIQATKFKSKFFGEASSSSYICLLFTSLKLFRISVRFLAEGEKTLDIIRAFVSQHTRGALARDGTRWRMHRTNALAKLEVCAEPSKEYGDINWDAQGGPTPSH